MLARSFSSLSVFLGAVLCALVLALGSTATSIVTAPSAAAQSATDITKAYFASGWFERNPSGEWDEYDGQGNLRYTFREIGRTDRAIKLYLKEYGVNVELDTVGREIFAEWPGRSRHVMHRITNMDIMAPTPVAAPPAPPPPSATNVTSSSVALAAYAGGDFLKAVNTWTENTSGGAKYTFQEVGHDDQHVYLFDSSRGAFIILDIPDRMIRYSRNGGTVSDLYPVTEFSVLSKPPSLPIDPPTTSAPPTPQEPEFPESPKLSTLERATCVATGGTVERAGILGAERCTRPYRDAGMICSDSSQCQGKCIAGTAGANQASTTGTCQETDNPFGCYAEVRNGQTGPGLCVD